MMMRNFVLRAALLAPLMLLAPVMPLAPMMMGTAHAQDALKDAPQDQPLLEKCTSAKKIVAAMTQIAAFDADLTSPVAMALKLSAQTEGGDPLTDEQIVYRHEGEHIALNINTQGLITNTHAVSGMSKDGELCRTAIGGGPVRESISMSASMNFPFERAADGVYTLASLMEGAREGRKQLIMLAPTGARLFIPKFTHIAITPSSITPRPGASSPSPPAHSEARVLPHLLGISDGQIGAPLEEQTEGNVARIYALSDLKAAGIDAVTIGLDFTHGPYHLEATGKPDKASSNKDENP